MRVSGLKVVRKVAVDGVCSHMNHRENMKKRGNHGYRRGVISSLR